MTAADSDDASTPPTETTFEEKPVPDHRDEQAIFEGTHERGDRRILRRFAIHDAEVVADAFYYLGGSRLAGIREGAVAVEDAEQRAGDIESFCRRWHERNVDEQLTDRFDQVIEENRDKPWVRRNLERTG